MRVLARRGENFLLCLELFCDTKRRGLVHPETLALRHPQSPRHQLILTDDVIADHAAVDAPPPMKAGWRTGLQIGTVLSDGKTVASWAVHHSFPERTMKVI
jgi:hypothetical protein